MLIAVSVVGTSVHEKFEFDILTNETEYQFPLKFVFFKLAKKFNICITFVFAYIRILRIQVKILKSWQPCFNFYLLNRQKYQNMV